jgi:hypothetical protein
MGIPLLVLLLSLPAVAQAQFSYTVTNGAITITRYSGPGGAVAIPDNINGLPVTSIGDWAFEGGRGLTSVAIPDSVTNIGDNAFGLCASLTNMTIPDSVTNIGRSAFWGCGKLRSVYFLGNAPSGDDWTVFAGDNTTVFYLPGTTGWGSTFGGAPTALVGSLVGPFRCTTNNGTITIIGYSGPGGAVIIPSIANGWPMTSIGDSAFESRSDVTRVTIPDSVTNIGQTAFATCSSLSAISVGIDNPAYASVAGVLFDKGQTTLIQYPTGKGGTSYTIPDGITTIDDRAFMNCGLTRITIPDSVTSIGNYVFNGCPNLTSITIPDSVTHLGDNGFCLCMNLTSVTIGNGVPSIEEGSFWGCTSLTNVTIGSSVTDIATWAFLGCSGLTSVTIPASVSSIGTVAFSGCWRLRAVCFLGDAPSGDSTAFSGDNATVYYLPGTIGWGPTFGGAPTALGTPLLVGPFLCTTNDGAITIIGYTGPGGAVSIPSTANGWPVIAIGNSAFASLSDMTSVTIPNSVTNIGETAFATCSSLSSINMAIDNPGYSSVGGVLFDKTLTRLIQYPTGQGGTTFAIPAGVTTIDDQAFMNCRLTHITIPDSVTTIGRYVFNACPNLSSITIPDSVTHLGDNGFCWCSSLTSVTIGNRVPSIEEGSFWNCPHLTNLTLGSSVNDIASWGFIDCPGLTSVTIPASVSSIGTVAFSGCTGLRAVYFLGNAPSGDSTVFSGDNNATVYYLPGTTGWDATFGGIPTALWVVPYPQILSTAPSFGVQSDGFGFIISWATNQSVVVEASTTLAQPVWVPLSTNALVNGWSYFSDPEWANYPARFYRVRSP